MPPLVVVAFLVSRNATDVISVRYLLPAVASLALTLASSMSFLWRARTHAPSPATARSRIGGLAWFAGLAAFTVLGGVAFAGSVRWLIAIGEIGPDRGPPTGRRSVRAVLAEMERQGIAGGYLRLLDSPTRRRFCPASAIIITPFTDWQPPPAYAAARGGTAAAWVFAIDPLAMDAIRRRQATEALRPLRARPRLEGSRGAGRPRALRIFSAPGGGRLLPPPCGTGRGPCAGGAPRWKSSPHPAEMSVGSTHRVRVRASIAATGLVSRRRPSALASWRCDASYRWIDAAAARSTEKIGERSPLPCRPAARRERPRRRGRARRRSPDCRNCASPWCRRTWPGSTWRHRHGSPCRCG